MLAFSPSPDTDSFFTTPFSFVLLLLFNFASSLFWSRSFISCTMSGKSSTNISFFRLNSREFSAKRRFSAVVLSHEPSVGVVSSMKLKRPVKIVLTDHAGFHVSVKIAVIVHKKSSLETRHYLDDSPIYSDTAVYSF